MKKLLFGLLLFISGCISDQKQTSDEDTSTQNHTDALNRFTKSTTEPFTDRKRIVGIWKSENKEPLIVKINRDSICYTEHFESHKYKLKGDSIFINYPGFVFAAKVYFKRDTLIMSSENGQSKYVKFQ